LVVVKFYFTVYYYLVNLISNVAHVGKQVKSLFISAKDSSFSQRVKVTLFGYPKESNRWDGLLISFRKSTRPLFTAQICERK
jgi:hypothetical protein